MLRPKCSLLYRKLNATMAPSRCSLSICIMVSLYKFPNINGPMQKDYVPACLLIHTHVNIDIFRRQTNYPFVYTI